MAGLPEEVVRRLEILEEIPPKILADMTPPTRSECIEYLVKDVETWLDTGYFGPYGEEEDQEYAAQRIACALKAVTLLTEPGPLSRNGDQ